MTETLVANCQRCGGSLLPNCKHSWALPNGAMWCDLCWKTVYGGLVKTVYGGLVKTVYGGLVKPNTPKPEPTYESLSTEIGQLVASKQVQYGDSVKRAAEILAILYPDGIAPHQLRDALLVVRICDKLSRIAQRGPDGADLGGESPYRDIAGYGILGWAKDEGVEFQAGSNGTHEDLT